jgi:hypothetical protein
MAKKIKHTIEDSLLMEYYRASLKDSFDNGVLNSVSYRLKLNSSDGYKQFKKEFLANPVENDKYYQAIYQRVMETNVMDVLKHNDSKQNKSVELEEDFSDIDFTEKDIKSKKRIKKEEDSGFDSLDDFLKDF